MFDTHLQHKTVFITGSTSGIGLAIAHAFASSGAQVILHGIACADTIAALKDIFKQTYQQDIICFDVDVSKQDALTAMCEEIAQMRSIDILVNNAGIQRLHAVENFPIDEWNQVIAVNLSAAFITAKVFLPQMKKNGWGRIINIASTHGLVASKFKAAYVAAKHGIIGLTKTIALEHATDGITVNAICPGWVDTEMVAKQYTRLSQQQNIDIDSAQSLLIQEKHPTHKIIPPKDVAMMAVYLASDFATHITGSSFSIDAGWTAQ